LSDPPTPVEKRWAEAAQLAILAAECCLDIAVSRDELRMKWLDWLSREDGGHDLGISLLPSLHVLRPPLLLELHEYAPFIGGCVSDDRNALTEVSVATEPLRLSHASLIQMHFAFLAEFPPSLLCLPHSIFVKDVGDVARDGVALEPAAAHRGHAPTFHSILAFSTLRVGVRRIRRIFGYYWCFIH